MLIHFHPLDLDESCLEDLYPLLQWLERRLKQAVSIAQVLYGAEAATDPYRGLHIDWQDIERLLVREPGVPLFTEGECDDEAFDRLPAGSRLARLQQVFGLSSVDLQIIVIAIAPEIDRRYERLYAYLQDDVRCKQPGVDLVLNLISHSASEKRRRRDHFSAHAPLIQHGLLHLYSDPNQAPSLFLSQSLKLDDHIVRYLLHQEGLDPRLRAFCQQVEPDDGTHSLLNQAIQATLTTLIAQAQDTDHPLRLYFYGPQGAGKYPMAVALANQLGVPLLVANLSRSLEAAVPFELSLKLLFREARLHDALLYFEELEALRDLDHRYAYSLWLDALADHPQVVLMSGKRPWRSSERQPEPMIAIPFTMPDFAQRRTCWQHRLAAFGIMLEPHDLDALSDRFRLTPHQIAQAVTIAYHQAQWRAAQNLQQLDTSRTDRQPIAPSQPTLNDLFAAARSQSSDDLLAFARKIEPKYRWENIVLPADPLAQLHEICHQAQYRHRVYHQWGFDRTLSIGKGLNVLFSGPPGTGKTMAAEVIANELQLDLYKIDLSQVVSKYIGETEKNLDRIFTAAESANAILFFDEADALFGKRSDVKDAHDRYANIEVGYLLQKMEEYEGIAILATNLRQNLDEAFVRRLAFTVHFPAPDEAHRRQIWATIYPPEVPLADDVDFSAIARQFKLSGGTIKNSAVAAAFLAAETNEPVSLVHLIHAIRREYQKMGKVLTDAQLKELQNNSEDR